MKNELRIRHLTRARWMIAMAGASLLSLGCGGSPELQDVARGLVDNGGGSGDDEASDPGEGPFPVEPGGGIGDGAGPIPFEPGQGPGGESGLPVPPPIPEGAVVCGGFSRNQCADDEYCAYTGDFCGAADATAICQTRPTSCDEADEPVCACDGNTYANGCLAAANGFGYAHIGACESQ